MKVRLDAQVAPSTREEVVLASFPVLVGRHHECKLRITSRLVSRHHCTLDEREGWLVVHDLGSANGTLVNGKRISGEALVHPGDLLEIGPVRMIVRYEPPGRAEEEEEPRILLRDDSEQDADGADELDGIDTGLMFDPDAPVPSESPRFEEPGDRQDD